MIICGEEGSVNVYNESKQRDYECKMHSVTEIKIHQTAGWEAGHDSNIHQRSSSYWRILSYFGHLLLQSLNISYWRRQWQHTPVLLPGKPHERKSLVGCSPWDREESDTTERLHFHFHFHALEKEMATHPSVLAWRIPGTGQPSGLPRLWGRTESDTTAAT